MFRGFAANPAHGNALDFSPLREIGKFGLNKMPGSGRSLCRCSHGGEHGFGMGFDIVFADAPKATMYSGWHYVLVEAGPEQAATWRKSGDWSFWTYALPDTIFPADRSWLVSTLWDDDWTCIGGPAVLVDRFLRHPDLQARLR